MSKATKVIVHLFVFIIATLVLAPSLPARAQTEGRRVIKADLTGIITIQQEDGITYTIDYEGTLRTGLFREQIVIDIIHAGVIRETGESVVITSRRVGVFQREGNRVLFDATGEFTLERENGSRIQICFTGSGLIQQNGRNIVIDIIDAGVVEATGENVHIHTTGVGTRTK